MRRLSWFLCLGSLLPTAAAAPGDDAKPRTDLYGDPLPPGAVMRLGTIRLRHRDARVAFSKEGKQLISCDTEGTVRVWDAASGKRRSEKRLPWERKFREGMKDLVLSPDGATVAAWDDNTISVCDLTTMKERGRIPHPSPEGLFFGEAIFSPDGKSLAIPELNKNVELQVALWDLATLKKRKVLTTTVPRVRSSLVFSPDGKRLAILSQYEDETGKLAGVLNDLSLWDTTTGKRLAKKEKLTHVDVDALAFAPDGKTLALGGRNEPVVRLLAADTLREKARLKAPAQVSFEWVDQLVFSPDGRRLAVAWGKQRGEDAQRGILLWDLEGGKEPRRLPARYPPHLVFAPDGRTLACQEVGEIRLYDAASGRPLHDRPGHDSPQVVLAASPDGKRLASGGDDGVLYLWDTTSGKSLRRLDEGKLEILECLFSGDGRRVAALGVTRAEQEEVVFQAWDAANGKSLWRIEVEKDIGSIHTAAISHDGKRLRTVLGANDGQSARLVVWDGASGKKILQRPYRLERHPGDNEGVPPIFEAHAAFAPDGKRLSVWLDDRIGLEDVSTGSRLATLLKGTTRPLAFSPDGRLLAARVCRFDKGNRRLPESNGLSLIETASGQEVLRLDAKKLDTVAFTTDGRGLIVADTEQLSLWDTDTGDKRYRMTWPVRLSIADTVKESLVADLPLDLDSNRLIALPGGRVATSMPDGDILVWQLPSPPPRRKPKRDLDSKEMEKLWSNLAGDGRTAHRALSALANAPAQTIPFLKNRLRPASVDGEQIDQLLADLESDSFERREAATRALADRHYHLEPRLRRALESKPSLEMRRRLQGILAEPIRLSAEDLRTLRAIALLERIGTPEACGLLEHFADKATASDSEAAQAGLRRLGVISK